MDLEKILNEYIFSPHIFWPDDTIFHSRNRQKINRAYKKANIEKGKYISILIDRLNERQKKSVPTLFAISNGSSGCHFFGSIIGDCTNYTFIKEVYFPSRLMKIIDSCSDESARKMLFDCVSYIHTGNLRSDACLDIPVNIMHLTKEMPTSLIKAISPSSMVLFLLRNPYDIAVSRSFRKEEYRNIVAPDMDDLEYLGLRANNVKTYYSLAESSYTDYIVRYENLTKNPEWIISDIVRSFGWDISLDELVSSSKRHDARRLTNGNSKISDIGNLNLDPKPSIGDKYAEVLYDTLNSTATKWLYELPSNISLPGSGYSSPQQKHFWKPMSKLLCSTNIMEKFVRNQVVTLLPGTAPFTFIMKGKIDWNKDEGNTKSWQLYYNSLCWLFTLESAYKNEDFPDFEEFLKDCIIDYIKINILGTHPNPMTWDDHAASFRLAVISYFYHAYLKEKLNEKERELFFKSLIRHIDEIKGYIASSKWVDNNHGVFHAISLLNVEAAFSDKFKDCGLGVLAKNYLELVLSNILDVDQGVSLEQSLQYHVWTIKLLVEIADFLDHHGIFFDFDVEKLIGQMFSFSYLLLVAHESLPAIGDTPYRRSYNEYQLRSIESEIKDTFPRICSRTVDFLLHPGVNMFSFPRAGYVVFRHQVSSDFKELDSLTLFKNSPKVFSHGHNDYMSVVSSCNGKEVLVDSGGPYAYGDKIRFEYFMAYHAHNVVSVDSSSYTGGCKSLWTSQCPDYSASSAEIDNNNGVSHCRLIMQTKDGTLLIVDELKAIDGNFHDMDLLFHFFPEAEIRLEDETVDISLSDGGNIRLWILANDECQKSIVSGQKKPFMQGWVTENHNEKKPAPVLCTSLSGGEAIFVSIFDYPNTIKNVECSFDDKSKKITIVHETSMVVIDIEDMKIGLNGVLYKEEK